MNVARFALGASAALSVLAGTPSTALAQQPPATQNPLVGFWQGTLQAGAVALRLVLNIVPGPAGALSGDLDSIDQGAMDIPIDSIALRGDSVTFAIPRIRGSYRGVLRENQRTIDGIWSQGPGSAPLTFTKSDGPPPGLPRPQEPKEPFPYRSEDVTFTNGRAEITLAGTLTVPEGRAPHPAVILISGSGPQDRDESLMGHKPFLVLADHLTRQGIAVLRYDDRGFGKSTGDFPSATSHDFASDVEAAVRYLRSRPEIARDRIGLVGHSEGGLIAPLVAVSMRDTVRYIVLIAGPGLPGRDILLAQGELIARRSGMDSAFVARVRRANRRVFDAIAAEPDSAAAVRRVDALTDSIFAELSPTDRAMLGGTREALRAAQQPLFMPWFRTFLSYDPRPTLRQVRQPVLAVIGERDLQVPAEENLAAIRQALDSGGNRDVTTVLLPRLNHLLQHAETGLPAEYGRIEETMAPQALERISSWIRVRVGLAER